MPDKIQQAYEAVKGSKLFLDENDFRGQLQSSPKDVFNIINKNGLFLDYDDFEQQLGIKKKVGGGGYLQVPKEQSQWINIPTKTTDEQKPIELPVRKQKPFYERPPSQGVEIAPFTGIDVSQQSSGNLFEEFENINFNQKKTMSKYGGRVPADYIRVNTGKTTGNDRIFNPDKREYIQYEEQKKAVLKEAMPYIQKDIDELLNTGKYKEFFVEGNVFDEGKAREYFDNYVKQRGGGKSMREFVLSKFRGEAKNKLTNDDPLFKETLQKKLKENGVDFNKYSEDLFNKLASPVLKNAEALETEVKSKAQNVLEQMKPMANELTLSFNSKAEAINERLKTGAITEQQAKDEYGRELDQYNNQLTQLNNTYKSSVQKIQAAANTKYLNIQRTLEKINAQVSGSNLFDQLPKEEKAKIEKAYQEAYGSYYESDNEIKKMAEGSLPTPTGTSFGTIFGKGFISGWYRGLSNIGNWLQKQGSDGEFTKWLMSKETDANVYSPAQYDWSQSEWYKRIASSTSTSMGASLPIMLPSIGVAYLTGGTSVPGMIGGAVASGTVGFLGERAQNSGDVYNQIMQQTGDEAKAREAANKFETQSTVTLPLYFIGGLGEVALLKSSGIMQKVAGGLLEQIEEIPTEYFQGFYEAQATQGYNKDFLSFVKEHPEIAADTFFATIGQSGAFATMGKLLNKSQAEIPANRQQYFADMIQREGFEFANEVLNKYRQTGVLDDAAFEKGVMELQETDRLLRSFDNMGLNNAQAKAMLALNYQSKQLKQIIDKEKDPALKIAYEQQMKQVNDKIKEFNTTTNYVTVTLPDGVSTRTLFESDIQRMEKNGKLNEFLSLVDNVTSNNKELEARLNEQKKNAKPLITDENQKEGQEELLNAPENTAQQQPVAAKPKQVVLPQQQEYKGRRLKVVYDGNKRVVKGKNGKVIKQDTPEAKRILRQHEDNYNYNFGQPAATEQMPENIAPEQAGRWIAENSNNPAEVAGLYLQEPKQTRFRDKKEELIAEYGIGKFTSSDFAGVDDKANITAGMAKSYFAGKGNAGVQGIDAYAKELSDHYGIEFTPQDVADFIKRFPNREFGATDRSETAEAAAQRFEELTGIPLTDRVAAMAAAQFAPEELVNEARQEEDAEVERPLTEDEILEINSLLQEDFENSDNLDTFTDDETGTIPETDTAADAQPDAGAAAESGSTPVQEGGEQQGTEQDEEIYEQNDDDLIGSLAAELENELNNPTELGTGGFEQTDYDPQILETNTSANAAFSTINSKPTGTLQSALGQSGRLVWVENTGEQDNGAAERGRVPESRPAYNGTWDDADNGQVRYGEVLVNGEDISGKTLQEIREQYGTGSEQFRVALGLSLATRMLQPNSFQGRVLTGSKKLSAYNVHLESNPKEPAFQRANSNGFITINLDRAVEFYNKLGEENFWAYAETAMQEEAIHALTYSVTTPEQLQAVYDELTQKEKADIREFYNNQNLDGAKLAAEYIRAIVQEKVFGVTTELFTGRSVLQKAKGALVNLLSSLKRMFGERPTSMSKIVTQRLTDAIKEIEAGKQIADVSGRGWMQTGTGRFDDELGVDIVDGFYSSLEKRLADMKSVKIPPKQWKERLKSQEAEFTGLNAWLDSKKESVSKEEVQQFLKDNRIEIREVVKSDDALSPDKFTAEFDEEEGSWIVKRGGLFVMATQDAANAQQAIQEAIDEADTDYMDLEPGQTKFSQYQLPGEKSNYKEVLVTLPSRVRFADKWAFYKSKGYNKESFDALPDDKKQDLFIEFKAEDKKQRESSVADFKSSHFDEPNILVHLRMNTRTDADGNKVLFIEEAQSDWGQKGKKEGFDNKELEKERNTLLDERRNLEKKESENIVVKKVGNTGFVNDFQTTYKNEDLQKSINQRYKEIDDRILKINSQTGITPSAPFVTDTNSWVKLGLKVALKEAVKQGADKIAWTTGDQQNERYDLSKQVNKIEVEAPEEAKGVYFVDIYLSNYGDTENLEVENGVVRSGAYKGQRLEDIIGKEYAEKVLSTQQGESKTLKEEDLKVGGKGMKGFYGNPADNSLGIVGNMAKSLFKQGVGTTALFTEKIQRIEGVQPFYSSDGSRVGSRPETLSTQHSITITPEIKLAVNRGLPFEMGTGGFGSNFNNNATVENFIRRNIGKYSDATIIQAVMKATGQDEKYARGMLDIAKKPLNDQQQEQLNEEVVDENVGELQEGERARNTTRKIPELDIATVQNLSEEAVKYFQKSNAVSLDEANRFIDNKPITDVVNYLLNVKKDGLTDDKRSTLFVSAINKLTALITEAREAGDNTLAESLALNQSQLLNEYMPQTTEWGRAIQIIRLLYQDPKNKGLFADQTAKDVIKKINEDADTPLSKEEEATITELIEEYAKAPEGLKQAEIMAKINQFAAEKVNLNLTDILTSIWYAKILSGPSTHVTNISANVFNAPFELANFAIRTAVKHKTLKHFAPMMGGFLRGLYRGFSEFGGILATGITTQESQKFFQSPLMETLDWNQVDNRTLRTMLKNPILFSFNPKVLRYVGRMLAGSDAMLQSAGQEAVAAALGEVYATNGAKKGDLRKASDYLFNNKADIEAAKMQAEKEGFKKDTFKNRMQYNRRVSEIINSKRAFDIFDKSKKEAAKITFNYEPKGIVARSVYNVITFGQKEIKILPFYVPFVRIVTNLVDNMMNYSPVGFVSAGIGMTKDSKGVRKMTGDERAEIFIKGLIGTSTLLALAAVAGDEEDDWFEVTANGTGDMLKNYELQKTGWRPYTITLKNGTSVSYKNTPLFPVFAAIGGARDWDKYKRKENEEASTSEEMKAAAGMFAFSIFDNSWLTGVNDLINTANITDDRGTVKQGLGGFTDKAVRKGVDVTSAFLLSNFSKSMIRYADAFNGKPLTKPDNDFERIVRDVPWVRDQFIDKQITDVWGDPVVNESWMGLSPFRMKPNGFVKDEVIDLLVKNNIWIGRPRANKELYDTETENSRLMTKDEYYKYYNRAGQILKQKLYDMKEDLMAADGDREAMLRLVSEKKQLANEEAFAELFNNE